MNENNNKIQTTNRTDNELEEETTAPRIPSSLQYERRSSYMRVRYNNQQSLNRKPRWIAPLIIIVVIVLAAAGIILYFNRGIGVLDLTNWSTGDAQTWARLNGINLRTQESYNDKYDAGLIFAQDVLPGSRINKNGYAYSAQFRPPFRPHSGGNSDDIRPPAA